MSYNPIAASTTKYGVVKVGSNIDVALGVISLQQDVSTTADVAFNTVTDSGDRVVTSVQPTGGAGIQIDSLVSTGPSVSFDITNTGVLSIIAGTGITVSGAVGDVTISSTGTSIINTTLVEDDTYTATASDNYIGVNNINPVTITLPVGSDGRTYTVKDESGVGDITVTGTGGETIDLALTFLLTIPFASATFVFRGTEWHVI
ncbi:hypothetical protein UFOVP116_306 [uncultured Caudovirales phage]|uniref:Uncharacterized protein n=1 Tax=uncultured Caudovirales phage TaxID=2100421 RepID=A0A6J5LA55_9CAUD|nr:hypothetical protein UFOVP116_306 [uncultured Caudovirales phage]